MHIGIDMSPAVINKTAIHRIIFDTLVHLKSSHQSVKPRICGISLPYVAIKKRLLISLVRRCLQFLFSHPFLLFALLPILRIPSRMTKYRTIYFDPLYTLFEARIDHSTVIVLDLTPITTPEFHHPNTCQLYRWAFARLLTSKCRFVAISQSTQQDLWVNFGIDPHFVTVIPLYAPLNGPIEKPIKPKDGGDDYLLVVSSQELRKNLKNTLLAYQEADLYRKGIKLKIVGGPGWGHGEIAALAQNIAGVELLGSLTDNQLRLLYIHCLGLVFVSFWEGFGLPYLEAMQFSKPILASITGAAPEVCGRRVYYADPHSVHEISEKMVRLSNIGSNEVSHMMESYKGILEKYSKSKYFEALEKVIDEISI